MIKFETNELLELVPSTVVDNYNLTKRQATLLGLFIVYNNLEQTKNNGFFFRSNKDICNDINISEPTLITAITKLEQMNIISRKTGNRNDGASEYKLNTDLIFNTKINTKNLSNNLSDNFSNMNFTEILGIIRDYQNTMNMLFTALLKFDTKNLSNNLSNNFSTESDTDIESEKELEKDNNISNNKIIKENYKEKENIINNILEKESEVRKEVIEDDVKLINFESPIDEKEIVDEAIELTDDELKEKIEDYFNRKKESVKTQTQYEELESDVEDYISTLITNNSITSEQAKHAKLYYVYPTLSSIRYNLLSQNEKERPSEPSNDNTLTVNQYKENNELETLESTLNEVIVNDTPNDCIVEQIEIESNSEIASPINIENLQENKNKSDVEQIRKKCIQRMITLYAQATSTDEAKQTYDKIVEGIEKLLEEKRIDKLTYSSLKQTAWYKFTDALFHRF